jgi:putative transposase
LKSLPDTAWLKEMDSQVPQQALRDLQRAFVSFIEGRAKFPRFKGKRAGKQTFRISQRIKTRSITHQPNVGEVYCPKVGWVRFKKSRQIEGELKGATFKRDALGHWFVTLTCRFEVPQASLALPPPDPERTIGLDAVLKDFVVSSDSAWVEPPKHYRRGQKKLRRAQRCLSRRKKGSRRREKAKRRVAKCHSKVANRRADFLHKLSTLLVEEHDAVYMEDLNLKRLTRTKLAKSFSDAAFGEFRRMLAYKSEWQDKRLIMVDRYFPSIRTCPVCGLKREAVALSRRAWRCASCATHHDRDLNAAQNIRHEGLRKLEAEGHPDS